MARARRTAASGLPVPRVQDTSLQRFLEGAAAALNRLDLAVQGRVGVATDGAGGTGGGGRPGQQPGPSDPTIPVCATPPVPEGCDIKAGVGVVLIFWDNPFLYCANHAQTQIFRGATDIFADAVQIGTSANIAYVDRTVASDTTYFYWLRWVSDTNVLGQPTEGKEIHVAVNPEEAIRELSDDILNDPLAFALVAPIRDFSDSLQWVRMQDRVSHYRTLLAQLVSSELFANVEGRISTAETELTALQATLGGRQLGPAQNIFTGTNRAAAEAARNAYAAANSGWLADYDADNTINILLRWGVLEIYQRRVSSDWVDNGSPIAQASALTAINATVMQHGLDITALSTSVTSLTASIAGLASAAAVTALTARVTSAEGTITALSTSVTSLTASIAGLASAAAVTALTVRVTSAEGTITALSTSVTSLTASIAGLASTAAVTLLTARVTSAEGTITALSTSVTSLTASIAGLASAAAVTLLTARVTSAEGTITALSTSVTSLTASIAGLASAAAVTALTARVTMNEGTITSISASVTQLIADVLVGATGIAANAMALMTLTARVTVNEAGIVATAASITGLRSALGPIFRYDDLQTQASFVTASGQYSFGTRTHAGLMAATSFVIHDTDANGIDRFGFYATLAADRYVTFVVSSTRAYTYRITGGATESGDIITVPIEFSEHVGGTSQLSNTAGVTVYFDFGSYALASAYNRLSTTLSDQAGLITANADAITMVQAGVDGAATAAALQELTARVAAQRFRYDDLQGQASFVNVKGQYSFGASTHAGLMAATTLAVWSVSSDDVDATEYLAGVSPGTLVDFKWSATRRYSYEITGAATSSGTEARRFTFPVRFVAESNDSTGPLSFSPGNPVFLLFTDVGGAYARWLVQVQVNDLVGGVGLLNDGTTVRFYVAADRFAVFPPGAVDGDDAIVPFIVDDGNVYINSAIINEATITGAMIGEATITTANIALATIAFANIAQGDIFDLTVGNKIESETLTATTGFRFLRDGTFILRGGEFRGDLQSDNYQASSAGWKLSRAGGLEANEFIETPNLIANVRNVRFLGSGIGVLVSNGATTTVLLEASAGDYNSLLIEGRAANTEIFQSVSLGVSLLSTGGSGSSLWGTSHPRANFSFGSGVTGQVQINVWRSAGAPHRLYLRAAESGDSFRLYSIIGFTTPETSTGTTTDTDPVYRRGTSTPGTPSGGTAVEAHTPSGWSRSVLTATLTQNVYWSTRTRTFVDGVFQSATSWATPTLFEEMTGTDLPDASAPTVTIAAVSSVDENSTQALSASVSGGTYDALSYAWIDRDWAVGRSSGVGQTWCSSRRT